VRERFPWEQLQHPGDVPAVQPAGQARPPLEQGRALAPAGSPLPALSGTPFSQSQFPPSHLDRGLLGAVFPTHTHNAGFCITRSRIYRKTWFIEPLRLNMELDLRPPKFIWAVLVG
jgi:hypothetical protein